MLRLGNTRGQMRYARARLRRPLWLGRRLGGQVAAGCHGRRDGVQRHRRHLGNGRFVEKDGARIRRRLRFRRRRELRHELADLDPFQRAFLPRLVRHRKQALRDVFAHLLFRVRPQLDARQLDMNFHYTLRGPVGRRWGIFAGENKFSQLIFEQCRISTRTTWHGILRYWFV
jgi:hypothetical protein